MTDITPRIIYFDVRALQDPDYRFRGVGQHSASLIAALRKRDWSGPRPEFVAVTDVAAGVLDPVHRRLFDRVTIRNLPDSGPTHPSAAKSWFLSLSPMTHTPTWCAAFLENPSIYRVALFYDLIPLDFAQRYLASSASRMDYVASLAWLKCYDAFAAISRFTADGLIGRMGIEPAKVFVSGVAVRPALEPVEGEAPIPFAVRRSIAVSGGGDPRKNPECALRAHAKSSALRQAGISISVFGNYPETMRSDLRLIYAENGGRPEDLSFCSHLTDVELHQLYRESLVTVVPSRAEGFSIPIVESNAAGTPVLASDVGAHPELAKDAEWRFSPDDPEHLRAMFERLAASPTDWERLKESQSGLWENYTEKKVGQTFISGVLGRAPRVTAPAVLRGAKPSIAVLTPLPPALSGVADYSAVTLRPLKEMANVHIFTPTPNAAWEEGWASMSAVSSAAFSPRAFDATIAVMGNSSHHTDIFKYLRDYGGACIAHDARQIDFYFHEIGSHQAAVLASQEMGKAVSVDEVAHWLRNQRELPTLFLSEIVRASEPLFVHSRTTATEIQRLYGVEPVVLPFAQYREPVFDRLGSEARRETREALGIRPEAVMLATFGIVSPDKAPDELVWTLKTLRDWGIDAELAFCGFAPGDMHELITEMGARLKISDHIRTFPSVVSQEQYSNYLVAADIGLQVRTYFMGGLSGALNDCIAAALPAIANEHLAEAMGAPGFVRRVPDGLSCVLMAEAALEIIKSTEHRKRPVDAAKAFAEAHSPAAYCENLMRSLGFADIRAKQQTNG